MNDEIMVTVRCCAYNQEKYIEKCLEGLVNQKTNFRYEILAYDDASTDSTAKIIREYEKKYPDIIKSLIQTENQYSKKVPVSRVFFNPLTKGKYIAICEGDDYWCDEYKLQKQVDFMENHPECHLCLHRVQAINEDGSIASRQYPNFEMDTQVFSTEKLMSLLGQHGYVFQTSSYMRRTEDVLELSNNPPEFVKICDVGDIVSLMFSGMRGSIYYIDDIMSCYRLGSIGSWNQIMDNDSKKKLKHSQIMVRVFDSFFDYSNHKYDELLKKQRNTYFLDACALSCNNSKNAKVLLKKENRHYLKKMSKKNIAYIFLCAYIPFFGKIYNKLKGKD